jgi:hypothetical protein
MKTLVIFLSFSLTLFGMSYEQFKRHTLKNSKILKSQTLTLQIRQQENNILLRTANPILNVEGSRFNEKVGDNSFGYAVSASQTIRMPGYMDGLQSKAKASSLLSQAFVTQGKAGY